MGAPGEELVDLIDEAGQTIGVVTRRQMRDQRLPHRCVYLLVFNHRGHLLVHQRTPIKDVFPSYWDVTAGGVLAAGESFEEGARREGLEELGVEVEPEPLFPFRYADERTIVQAMVYKVVHDGPFTFQLSEIVQGFFVPWPQVADMIASRLFCPDGLAVLRSYSQEYLS
ncbi:MAG: NUDIX domain-containing protein [Gemmataceae bacterium]